MTTSYNRHDYLDLVPRERFQQDLAPAKLDERLISIPNCGSIRILNNRDRYNAASVNDLIRCNASAFERHSTAGHITASTFVLDTERRHVLLTHHAKLDSWLPLGGHCDGIRDARFVALKEAYEESGLLRIDFVQDDIFDIDIHDIPKHGSDAAHVHFDIRFLLQTDMTERLHPTHESKALAWVALEELERFTSKPSVLVLKHKLGCL